MRSSLKSRRSEEVSLRDAIWRMQSLWQKGVLFATRLAAASIQCKRLPQRGPLDQCQRVCSRWLARNSDANIISAQGHFLIKLQRDMVAFDHGRILACIPRCLAIAVQSASAVTVPNLASDRQYCAVIIIRKTPHHNNCLWTRVDLIKKFKRASSMTEIVVFFFSGNNTELCMTKSLKKSSL